jgi:hypothetical protein
MRLPFWLKPPRGSGRDYRIDAALIGLCVIIIVAGEVADLLLGRR